MRKQQKTQNPCKWKIFAVDGLRKAEEKEGWDWVLVEHDVLLC